MCLTILELPASQRDSNCIPCTKRIHYGTMYGPVTPYQWYPVPADGVLWVDRPASEKKWGKSIEGGAIHANGMKFSYPHEKNHKAYAFGVIAYGVRKDLCCSLLYIPELDTNPRGRRERMRQINLWLRQPKGPTNTEVKKLFRHFRPSVR